MANQPKPGAVSGRPTELRRFARRKSDDEDYVEIIGETQRPLTKAPWLGGVATGRELPNVDGPWRAPVDPSKILCVGRNFAAHAKELGNDVPKEPLIFMKPPSSLLDPGGTVLLPKSSSRIEHEAELAVVVGARLSKASRAECEAGIFGFTIACDVTARDLQKTDGQWWRAKGMDTFCPVGPFIVAGVDPSDLRITCRVNGEMRQDGRTSQMVFGVAEILEWISASVTLLPGDLILTGTPEGVGPIPHGAHVEIGIDPLGLLSFDAVRPLSP